jgi:hypothetical protein
MDASPDHDQPIPYVPADGCSQGAWVLEGPEDTVVLDLDTGTMTSARRIDAMAATNAIANAIGTARITARGCQLAQDVLDMALTDLAGLEGYIDTLSRAAHLAGPRPGHEGYISVIIEARNVLVSVQQGTV